MDFCIDHPDELAVFECQTCSRLICNQHQDLLCKEHSDLGNRAWPVLIVFIVVITFISVISYYIYIELNNVIQEFSGISDGDTITVDGETIIASNIDSLPDLSTILLFVLLFLAPIFIGVIIFVRRQIMKYQQSPQGVEEKVRERIEKSYFCQSCGEKNTMKDELCIKCGKSTADERNLVG